MLTRTHIAIGLSATCIFAACGTSGDESPPPHASGGAGGVEMSAVAGNAAGSDGTGGGGTVANGGGGVSGGSGGFGGEGIAGASGSSASGGAAGTGGAGGSGGLASTCVTMGTELCDDFEKGGGQLNPQTWKINKPTSSASVVLDKVHAHSGEYAVHIKVVAGQQSTAMITESVTFPAVSNSFYTRMFVYFSPEIPEAPTGDFHTGFILGLGKNDKGDVQAGMGMIGSAKQYLGYSIFFADPKYEFGPWSKTKIVPNQWLCVELFENGSDPATEIRQVWLNDNELTDLKSSSAMAAGGSHPNHLPPKFDSVALGIWEYHPIPTLSDMWIDDVRVSSKKIGCTN